MQCTFAVHFFMYLSMYFITKSFRKIHLFSIQFFLNTMQKKTLKMTFRIYSDPLWFSNKSKLGTEKLSKRDEKHRAKIINHQPNINPLICKMGWNIFWKAIIILICTRDLTVNSVQEAWAKCFAVHVLKFEIL